ncbi:MAG TPA: class II aldolase/adducin family protein, partial [Thermoleophilia bacterium]
MGQYHTSREQVVSVCRALLDRGYLKATEGNVSVRVPGQEAFAITPSNYDYAKMKPDDICVLDHDVKRIEGSRKASIESGMHAAVYARRPDVNAIVHTHQPYASALAVVRRPIPALFDEQVRYLGRSVEIIDYAPSGTSFLKKHVEKALGSGANAFILANHGVLVLGGDAERAVFNMALLEKVALDYLLALLTVEKVHRVPVPIREIAFAKLRGDEKKLKKQLEAARATAAAGAASPSDDAPAAAGAGP